MANLVSRRDFLKLGGAATGVLAAGAFIPPAVAQAAREAGHLNAQGDGYIPSLCEMCVWRCGLLAKVKDGRVVKLEGNPDHPHSKGKLCPRGPGRNHDHVRSGPCAYPAGASRKPRRRQVPQGLLGRGTGHRCQSHAENQRCVWTGGNGLFVNAQPLTDTVREPPVRLWIAQLRNAAVSVLQRHGDGLPTDLRRRGTQSRLHERPVHSADRSKSGRGHLQLRDRRVDRGHRPWGEAGVPRSAVHQDGRQGSRVDPDPPRYRSGLPSRHDPCDRDRETRQLRIHQGIHRRL